MSTQPGPPFPDAIKAPGTKAQVSFPGQRTGVLFLLLQGKAMAPLGENIWALRGWNAPGLCPHGSSLGWF